MPGARWEEEGGAAFHLARLHYFTWSSVQDRWLRLMLIFYFFSSPKTHTLSWSSRRQEPKVLSEFFTVF